MATREELLQALRAADAAGDSAAAQAIARRLGAQPTAAPVQPSESAIGAPAVPAGTPLPTGPLPIGREAYLADLAGQPAMDRFFTGLGVAGKTALQGAQQSMGKDVPESEIRDWRDLGEQGGAAGTVGQIAGNVGMLALPLLKAERGMAALYQMLPRVSQRLAHLGAASTVGGATAAALDPVLKSEGETKGMQAVKGAALPLAISGAVRGLTGAVRPSVDAVRLMAQGIMPTVGQAGEGLGGSLGRWMENITEALPGVGRAVRSGRERAGAEAVQEVARLAHPANMPPTGPINRGAQFTELRQDLDAAYDNLLQGRHIPLGNRGRDNIRMAAQRALGPADAAAHAQVNSVIDRYIPQTANVIGGRNWKTAQNRINMYERRYRKAADSNPEFAFRADAYKAISDQLQILGERGLGAEDAVTLRALGESSAAQKALRKAAGYANIGKHGPTFQDLRRATEATTPKNLLVENSGRLQQITEPGRTVFQPEPVGFDALLRKGSYLGSGAVLGGGLGALGAPVLAPAAGIVGLGMLGSTRPGAKALMGQYEMQRRLANLMRGRSGSASVMFDPEGE